MPEILGALVLLVVVVAVVTGLTVGIFGRRRPRGLGAAGRSEALPGAGPSPLPAPPADDPVARIEALDDELTRTVRRAKASGGRLPVAAVPAVREVEDVMVPLLAYLRARPGNPEELRQATAIVHDHLSDALDRYLALPEDYLATARTPEGRTVAEELVDQLNLLVDGAQQTAKAVYDGDAQQLAVGRRFLDAKFRRSDLDL